MNKFQKHIFIITLFISTIIITPKYVFATDDSELNSYRITEFENIEYRKNSNANVSVVIPCETDREINKIIIDDIEVNNENYTITNNNEISFLEGSLEYLEIGSHTLKLFYNCNNNSIVAYTYIIVYDNIDLVGSNSNNTDIETYFKSQANALLISSNNIDFIQENNDIAITINGVELSKYNEWDIDNSSIVIFNNVLNNYNEGIHTLAVKIKQTEMNYYAEGTIKVEILNNNEVEDNITDQSEEDVQTNLAISNNLNVENLINSNILSEYTNVNINSNETEIVISSLSEVEDNTYMKDISIFVDNEKTNNCNVNEMGLVSSKIYLNFLGVGEHNLKIVYSKDNIKYYSDTTLVLYSEEIVEYILTPYYNYQYNKTTDNDYYFYIQPSNISLTALSIDNNDISNYYSINNKLILPKTIMNDLDIGIHEIIIYFDDIEITSTFEVIESLNDTLFLASKNESSDTLSDVEITTDNNSLNVRINEELYKFLKVYINGNKVNVRYYLLKEGSTIIDFDPDFIKTLPIGDYELKVVFVDKEATASFSLSKEENYTLEEIANYYKNSNSNLEISLNKMGTISNIIINNKKLSSNDYYINNNNIIIKGSRMGELAEGLNNITIKFIDGIAKTSFLVVQDKTNEVQTQEEYTIVKVTTPTKKYYSKKKYYDEQEEIYIEEDTKELEKEDKINDKKEIKKKLQDATKDIGKVNKNPDSIKPKKKINNKKNISINPKKVLFIVVVIIFTVGIAISIIKEFLKGEY